MRCTPRPYRVWKAAAASDMSEATVLLGTSKLAYDTSSTSPSITISKRTDSAVNDGAAGTAGPGANGSAYRISHGESSQLNNRSPPA